MDERADGELQPVADPEVDVAALTTELRAAAAQRHGGSATTGVEAGAGMGWTGAAGPWRSPVDDTATIHPYSELTSRGLVRALQRAVRRALRWYLWPVVERISGHNRATSSALAENRRQLAVLRMESERVQRELELARGARGGIIRS